MIKLLSSLLSLLDRLWAAWHENKLRQQGRQEAIKEANDEINRQIELGEAAVAVPDPERDERLRNRFDRSRTPK
jgi:hypothetical protein